MLSEHNETPKIPQHADINGIANRLISTPDVSANAWIERIDRMIYGLEENSQRMPRWMETMLSDGIFEGCTVEDLKSIRSSISELLSKRN